MSIRNFRSMFDPGSVAVFGASQQAGHLGTIVFNNMAEGGYAGALWPVNPKYDSLLGVPCYADIAALPRAPDLAVICTPPATIPALVAQLGARGTRAVIVLTPGLDAVSGGIGKTVQQAMLDAARPHLVRILGPGGVGLLSPAYGLNASLAQMGAKAGRIAFVSESDAVMTAALDWAQLHGVGYSKCVTLGERGDIDLGDLLDFLADDDETSAILLYLESVVCARKFMTAGRLASRAKPVIVMRAGVDKSDDVYDAAFRRAGMLRVRATEDLFDAAETLARVRPLHGEHLGILCNGASLGRIACDALAADGGAPAGAPVVLAGGAEAQAWADALDALLHPPKAVASSAPSGWLAAATMLQSLFLASAPKAGPESAPPPAGAILLLFAPAHGADVTAIAQVLAPLALASGKNVLSCWLGGTSVAGARQVFLDAGLPTYDTPEQAVRGFMQILQYRRNQDQLNQVPGISPPGNRPEREAAHALIARAAASGRRQLAPAEVRTVLAAYGVQMQGASLDLSMADGVPGPAVAAGLVHELSISVETDPMFGPVIRFGRGGVAAQLVAGLADEQAVGLPPLNMVLASELVARTRVARALAGQDGAEGWLALCHALIQVSDLVSETAELAALTINPLLADASGVRALDATMTLGPPRASYAQAIRPYPQELEQEMHWQGGPLLLRPIRPEDAPQHREFFAQLHPEDVRLRFFSAMRELQPAQLARLTQIDYDRAMAFIASRQSSEGRPETLGVVRAVADPDNRRAEFAILVRSDLKGMGLGAILFQKLVDYFRGRGTAELVGEALSENSGVQHLVRRFGGTISAALEPGMTDLRINLQDGSKQDRSQDR